MTNGNIKKLLIGTGIVTSAYVTLCVIENIKNNIDGKISNSQNVLQKQIENPEIKASEIDPELVTAYKSIYNKFLKRGIDVALSSVILIGTSPIMLLASAAIVFENGLPVFYVAQRGGLHGKPFEIYKFRSMVKNADKIGGGTTALHDDRITKVGNILRKTKIDEFPNVINVLKGDMSFIGPRPELLQYTEQYKGTEKRILDVRPGMTDYSSLAFINLDEMVGGADADAVYEEIILPKKNKLRVKYAATVSFSTDVYLFCTTVKQVFDKGFGFLFKNEHR